jgi:hypothetical protein
MKPGEEAVILVNRKPAILTDIFPESLLTDGFQDLLIEITVRAIKKIVTICHDSDFFLELILEEQAERININTSRLRLEISTGAKR